MNKQLQRDKSDVVFIFILLLISTLFRMIYYTSYIQDVPYALYPMNDAQMYWQWGLNLYRNGWMYPENEAYYQAPLYPLFIAFLHHIGIHTIKGVIHVQLALGVLNSILCYVLLRQYISKKISLVYSIIISLCPVIFFYETKITATTVGLFLWLLYLTSFIFWINKKQLYIVIFSAVFLVLSIGCRPNLLFTLPFILLCFVSNNNNENKCVSWSIISKYSLHKHVFVFLVIVLFGIFSVSLRNYICSGEWVLISGNSGVTLYMGNNPNANGGLSVISGLSNDIQDQVYGSVALASELSGSELTLNESSRYWVNKTIQYVIANPVDWILLVCQKVLWSVYYLPPSVNYSIPFESEFIGYLPYLSILTIFILLSGLLSIFSYNENKKFFLYCIFGYVLLSVIYYSSSRFLTSLIPVLAVLSALECIRVQKINKQNKQIQVFLLLYIWIGLLFVINPFFVYNQKNEKAMGWYNLGAAHENGLNYYESPAICYQNALQFDPNHISTLNNLGVILAKEGKLIKSTELFEKVLDLDPQNQLARDNLNINYQRMK